MPWGKFSSDRACRGGQCADQWWRHEDRPTAKLDDGKLELCVVHAIDRFKLFCLFPATYFGQDLRSGKVD